jgi:hypothetical protein
MHAQPTGSLWIPLIAPAVWAVHFLACYVTTAIACAKPETQGAAIADIRVPIILYSVLGLAAVLAGMHRGWRQRSMRAGSRSTEAAQHRFLADVTLLLGALSAVAMIYVALPAMFFASCR